MHSPLARSIGAVLRGIFAVMLVVRRPRPIHPRGRLLAGEIRWLGNPAASGIGWIDEPPAEPLPVIARLSRSVGFPAPLPDIIGLALRFQAAGRPADIELASTGFGPFSRFVLAIHRSPSRARLGTLLPYRSAVGPILLCARTRTPRDLPSGGQALDDALAAEPWCLRLFWARGRGAWHPFADLTLRPAERPDDAGLRFDSGQHMIPGARMDDWVKALRQPAYDLVQGEPARPGQDSSVSAGERP